MTERGPGGVVFVTSAAGRDCNDYKHVGRTCKTSSDASWTALLGHMVGQPSQPSQHASTFKVTNWNLPSA
jgi:hypothetical protein